MADLPPPEPQATTKSMTPLTVSEKFLKTEDDKNIKNISKIRNYERGAQFFVAKCNKMQKSKNNMQNHMKTEQAKKAEKAKQPKETIIVKNLVVKLMISLKIEPPLEREAHFHSSPMTGQTSCQKTCGKMANRRDS